MLSNLETESEKLIQIIFLGQPELKKKLALPRLEQLRQRIAVYFHLTPLSEEDTRAYILYRLKMAGSALTKVFTEEAIKLVYEFSQGVPRLINQICDSALLSGYVYGTTRIDEKIMREVIAESPMQQITGAAQKTGLKKEDRGAPDLLELSLSPIEEPRITAS